MSSDFWVITCYFNPARFKTKRRNFDAFMAGMRNAGANVLVVESAFGDDPFELEPGDNVLQLRGTGVMWQKERLLNIAAARLPASARKIGWFDADIIFKEPDWLERTSRALDRYVVVQPFSHAVRLHRDNRDDGTGVLDESFASMFVRDPSLARTRQYQVPWPHRLCLGGAPRVVRAMRSVRRVPDRQRRSSDGPCLCRGHEEFALHAPHLRGIAGLCRAFRALGRFGP